MITKIRQLKLGTRRRLETSRCGEIYAAAILHLDIVGSTRLVQQDLALAHRQIQQLYVRLRQICNTHNGIIRELRGDAAVIEFDSAANALRASIAIHETGSLLNRTRIGKVSPDIRTGISYGPIIRENGMITGQAVIRAQRIEQLAPPGAVLFDQFLNHRLEQDCDLQIDAVDSCRLKGFDEPVAIYRAQPRQQTAMASYRRGRCALIGVDCATASNLLPG